MPTQTTSLYLLQDLQDPRRTKDLADTDLQALQKVAHWIETLVVRPNVDLGRTGPVCPFVPQALERGTLWLAAERVANRSVPELLRIVQGYQAQLLRNEPIAGDDVQYKAIVVVLTDVSADRAVEHLNDVHVQSLKKPSYEDDGVVLGEFHVRNDGTAIYNSSFRPFRSPVPFLLLRHAVPSDWMFFLEDEDWLGVWARRFGESAVPTLAAELRHTNWRRLGA